MCGNPDADKEWYHLIVSSEALEMGIPLCVARLKSDNPADVAAVQLGQLDAGDGYGLSMCPGYDLPE